MRSREDQTTGTKGWQDKSALLIRIPIRENEPLLDGTCQTWSEDVQKLQI